MRDVIPQMERRPCRCSGCFVVSDPRPLGQTPEGWTRGRWKPGHADQGRYWCPECTDTSPEVAPRREAGGASRERLARLLSPELLDALDVYVRGLVDDALGEGASAGPEWLTLEAAGALLGCSAEAVRHRARRGRLETRAHGRRLYVSAASVRALGT